MTQVNGDGTIWDYEVTSSDQEVSKNSADSTDSYAATFLSLMKAYLDASGDRAWVRENLGAIRFGKTEKTISQIFRQNVNCSLISRKIADAIWLTYDQELHLTYALPTPSAAYLMDNVEVWKGLEDYGILLGELNHPDSEDYHYRAELIRNGIYYKLWNSERNEYQVSNGNFRIMSSVNNYAKKELLVI